MSAVRLLIFGTRDDPSAPGPPNRRANTPGESVPRSQTSVATDTRLVERLRASDASAFEALHKGYWQRLVRYAFRTTGSLDAAYDIVQGVFTDLWLRRATWQPYGS